MSINRRDSRYFDELRYISQTISDTTVFCNDKKQIGEFECPICYETFSCNKQVKTSCNHTYCEMCLINMMKSAQTALKTVECAMCRGKCSLLETYNDDTFTCISETLNYIENLEFLELEYNDDVWDSSENLRGIRIYDDEYYRYDELSHYEYESDDDDYDWTSDDREYSELDDVDFPGMPE
tara:strand:- start:50 stop:592 length:543 start_codon:yes stop_codon:yes gene_type:complete